MKKEIPDYKMIPTVRWVQPAPPQSLLLRTTTLEGDKKEQPNRFIMFDEIFPGKKDSTDGSEKIKNYRETDDTFHRAMAPVMTIGQCFGILPVTGLRELDSSFLKFSWCSWRVFYTFAIMTACGLMTFQCFLFMGYVGVDIYKITTCVFYGSTFLVLGLFFRLATRWPSLALDIARKERVRPAMLRNQPNRRSLRSKFNICCFAILFPALIEHLLSTFAGLTVADDCKSNLTLAESYFTNSNQQVFHFTKYSFIKGIILQIITFESAFNWNFMDLFIIVISLGLTDRFDQLNERLDAIKGKHLSEQFWKAIREEFSHISRLVKEVDIAINEITLLSFANNLYFICMQLFQSLKPLRGWTHAIYFTFSFGFLMSRSLAVSLGAARIHTAAQHPSSVLYAAPSSSYNAELQRLIEQVVTDKIALTGLNFFHVTRGLVLTIAGTIVTYELVLVQFNGSSPPATANITISDRCGIPIKT